ncbi:hypothetical protein MUK42_21365 [Musa troglodytarum]|uniref:Uncharacterized protein n=1 Tax=Musa troglodytarum TaxID=320322 RepID=A0A9E7EU23_9LILI|nr:hypothetical protein MUK42_21365 [Musa troglodytarum]
MIEKASDGDVASGRSFRCIHRWQRKLCSSPSMVEGAAHGSSGNEGNCARKLDLWTRLSVVEQGEVASSVESIKSWVDLGSELLYMGLTKVGLAMSNRAGLVILRSSVLEFDR